MARATSAVAQLALVVCLACLAATKHHGPPTTVGNLQSVTQDKTKKFGQFSLVADNAQLRVTFYNTHTVRVQLADDGNFTDPAAEIIVGEPSTPQKASVVDKGVEYIFSAGDGMSLHAQKEPLLFSMVVDGQTVWKETSGITWDGVATWQTVASATDEYYFGGGMQNGRFSHRNTSITISSSGDWSDGGNPNAVPYYVSSAGYSVLRATWAPGTYNFTNPAFAVASHNETRFDGFFFAGDFKQTLDLYTRVTGRPFLPPLYGLGLGDSDCYHNARHGNSTRVVVAVADAYRQHNMPGAWILPNDGYGCGYGEGPESFPLDFSDLDYVVAALHKRGFYTGLWSSTGLPNITREVGGSGTRIAKTDVGWIGRGYKYAFDAVTMVTNGIEDNSDGRRFIWTVEGWAGTHRMAVMWCGDDYGTFDYIRWQLPTFAGCGFSAQAHVSGDIDGIFGGSPDSYTRDLQMKVMNTVLMTMSGWAANPDKQPWAWGEPHTSINRFYLLLKMRLTPYQYTYSRIAHDTGVPPIRAMALEFPDDVLTMQDWNGSRYQYMSGESLLVAPVFEDASTRDSIYLPAGQWHDYWDGTVYKNATGGSIINGYDAPLQKLPLFVKAGAIIPMWPEMLYFNEKPHDPITLDIYPYGRTNFTMYEDDGVTRLAINGSAFAKTLISCDGPGLPGSDVVNTTVTVGPSQGEFAGKLRERSYHLQVHTKRAPQTVTVNGDLLTRVGSFASLDAASTGWFFTRVEFGGVVYVKPPPTSTSESVTVVLGQGPNYKHICLEECVEAGHPKYNDQSFSVTKGDQALVIKEAIGKDPQCLTFGVEKDTGSGTPAVELQPCVAPVQQWVYNETDFHLHQSQNVKSCIDFDTSDKHAIIYGCHAGGNQRWLLNPNGTKRIVSFSSTNISKDLCMTGCTLAEEAASEDISRHTPAEQAKCLADARRQQLPAGEFCGLW